MHPVTANGQLRLLGWALHGAGILTALAVALLAELLVYRPIDARAHDWARRAEGLHERLEDATRVRREHARLSHDLAVAREQTAALKKRIPDAPCEADFLAQVSRLADEIGLRIQDYRPGAVTAKTSYSVLRVDLICEGDYPSVCRFLDGLSQLPRHCTVVRLQIDSAKSKQDYSANMSLELYFGVTARSDAGQKGGTDA